MVRVRPLDNARASWQITRLSSSSPVTAITRSARATPAVESQRPSEASWGMTEAPSSSSRSCALRRFFFKDDDFVPTGRQVVRQRGAHFAAARNDYEHG